MQSLRAKLIGLLLLCSSVPIAFLGWRNDTLVYRDFWRYTEQRARAAADHSAEMVDDLLTERLQHLSDMAREASAGGNSLVRLKPEMQHYARFWKAILVADRTGRVVLASQPDLVGQNLSGRDYFEGGLKGQPFVSGAWVVEGKPVIALSIPVPQSQIKNRKSQIRGVLVAYISTDPLRHLVGTVTSSIGHTSFGVLVDENLINLAHTTNPSHELRPLAPLPDDVRKQYVAQRRLGDQTGALVQTAAHPAKCGPKVTVAVHSIDRWSFQRMDAHMQRPVHILGTRLQHYRWTVLVGVPDAAVQSQIAAHHRLNLTTAVLVMLAAVLLGLFFSQRLVGPLENLTEAAKRMGGGDLAARAEEKGSSEVAVLARSFNQMAGSVQRRNQEMVNANQALQTEISERKLAEDSLARLRRQAESVLHSAGEGIFGLDVHGNHTFVNLAGATMLGYTVEELIGRHSHSTWHHTKPDGTPYPVTECPIYAALRDGEVDRVTEEVFWRKDGTSFPVEYVSTPIREQDEVSGAVVVFDDITERKRAEQAVRESEAQFRAIVEAFDGFIYICSQDYRVEFMNDRLIQRTGYDATGQPCYQALHGLDAICPWCKNDRVFKGETVRWEVKSPKDDRWYYVSNVPIHHADGSMSKQSMILDITDRKRAEERLAMLNDTFLTFGAEPFENINRLVALCGEQLGATCALYNRLEDGVLRSLGRWHTPPDYIAVDKPEGHVCNDVIKAGSNEVWVITDLPKTTYAQTDPNVVAYGLRTYAGKAVTFGGAHVGSLCVVYQDDYAPGEGDKRLLEIVASAIGVEEERQRAAERVREESAINAALLDLETALGKAQSIRAVCEAAVELVPSLVSGARGFVWLWDGERNRLRPAASPAGLPEDQRTTFFSPDVPYEREQDFAEVLRTRAVLVVEDVTRDSRVNQEAVRTFGTHSFIFDPLMAGDQILGVMSVERGEAGAFSEREVELTRAAAQRIGMALSGEGARDDVQQQFSRVSLLNQTVHAIAERQDVESVFRVVLHTIEREMPVDIGAVLSYDTETETFAIAAVGTKSSALLTELGLTEGTQIPMDDALRACLKNEAVYIPDNSQFEAPAPRRLGRAGIGSSALVPLTVEGKLKGILIAARNEVDGFTSGDCEFLRQLAEHVALVIHHAGLYQDLQKSYDELQSAQQSMMQQERLGALGQLASGIAHDINNALSPVVGYSELLLLRGGWDERTRNHLEAISTAGKDIAAVVARLREFYRKREGKEQLLPVDVFQLAKTSVSLTQPRWHDMPMERGVVVNVSNEVPQGLPALLGDEAELREALTNLIINAVDAMPEGGTITLRARAGEKESGGMSEAAETVVPSPSPSHSPTHIILEISDTGVGMSDEVRLKCLEPFYSTKGERGTGMGLSMVYGILRRHEGRIDILTAPGQGTTFVLSLPITRETRPEAAPKRETVKPLRVLCVDDDSRLRELLIALLTQLGHHVETAEGGQEGIDVFDPRRFDVVITDLGMPVVDGRAVAKAIKERSPETPVILLTGWGTRMHAEGESPSEVDLVLGKPVKPEELQDALRRVTEGRPERRA